MFRRSFLPPVMNLLAFEAAARHGSISRAAEELHLTQSAISRQIRQLEDQLAVALFRRVRQRVVLTDAGRMYAADLRQALSSLSSATQKLMSFGGTGGVLNLAVLPTFGTRWLIPRMPRFAALQPELTVNYAARPEPFDFAAEPFDAAIHFGLPHWAGALCERLMGEEVVAVASPAYQQQHKLLTPEALLHATLLQQTTRPSLWAQWFEQLGLGAQVALRGPRFEQFAMMAQAAAAGLGVALVPRFLVADELAAGALRVLFPHSLASDEAYYLVVPEARAANPWVRAFRDWVIAEAQNNGSG